MSSYKGTAVRLLKCFCGCQDMTVEEVQRIYYLTLQATLIDRPALKLFKSYLERNRRGDKSLAEQYIEVYELCGEYMKPHVGVITLDELDELVDLGLPRDLEKELTEQIKTGDGHKITRCLLRVQGTLRNAIEESEEYKGYRDALAEKLNLL
ncbi:uncharacterized protein LOC133326723 [Musca vetustissima]|uniref:uncharacterized protein LOC133326723 n=1 Tax=Musca vetustissima TaxID=27455 RepID=UPI002AB6CF4F|nr:uncharacterized protein LOC133326723 [Musca vetustissima]